MSTDRKTFFLSKNLEVSKLSRSIQVSSKHRIDIFYSELFFVGSSETDAAAADVDDGPNISKSEKVVNWKYLGDFFPIFDFPGGAQNF